MEVDRRESIIARLAALDRMMQRAMMLEDHDAMLKLAKCEQILHDELIKLSARRQLGLFS